MKNRENRRFYKDEYLSILVHEMTHVMQLLDVVVRYLKMKNIVEYINSPYIQGLKIN